MMPTPKITEKDFQESLLKMAQLLGWWVFHPYDSRRSRAGFPDLVLLKEGHPPLFRELKTDKGRVRPEQQAVGDLMLATGLDWAIWRPADWKQIHEVLSEKGDR